MDTKRAKVGATANTKRQSKQLKTRGRTPKNRPIVATRCIQGLEQAKGVFPFTIVSVSYLFRYVRLMEIDFPASNDELVLPVEMIGRLPRQPPVVMAIVIDNVGKAVIDCALMKARKPLVSGAMALLLWVHRVLEHRT